MPNRARTQVPIRLLAATAAAFLLVVASANARTGNTPAGLVRGHIVDYAKPPGGPGGGGSPTAMATDFKLSKQRWFDSTVKYSVDDSACGAGSCSSSVDDGFNAWENLSGIRFSRGTETNACTGDPNSVSWQPIDGPGNVLAETLPCYYLGTGRMAGFDIILDSGDPWSNCGSVLACSGLSPQAFSIQAVVTHEAGHVVGLDHVSAPRDARLTMYPYINFNDFGFATLGCGDQLGVAKKYGSSFICTNGTVALD